MFRQPQINVPLLGIVENMAYFTPEELPDNKYYIFGQGGGRDLAEEYDIPLLAQLPLFQSVAEDADGGRPAILNENTGIRKYFEEMADNTAQQIAILNAKEVIVGA